MTNSHTTIYTVHTGNRTMTTAEAEKVFENIEEWGAENKINVVQTGSRFLRIVKIINDTDKVLFLLKYGHLVVNTKLV